MTLPTFTEIPTDLRYLKGVGPKRAQIFLKLGILSIRDLLYFFPRRYEDRSKLRKISQLILGETATIEAEILSVRVKPIRRMPILEVLVGDESGTLSLLWFNQIYLKSQFTEGKKFLQDKTDNNCCGERYNS